MLFTWIAALLLVIVGGSIAAMLGVLNPIGNAIAVWGLLFWAPMPIRITAACGAYFFTMFASTWMEIVLSGQEGDLTAKLLNEDDEEVWPGLTRVVKMNTAKIIGLAIGVFLPALKPMGFVTGLDTAVLALLGLMAVSAAGAKKAGAPIPTVFAGAALHMGIVLLLFAVGSYFQITNLVFVIGNALFIPMMLDMKRSIPKLSKKEQFKEEQGFSYVLVGVILGFVSLFTPGTSHYVLLMILPLLAPAVFNGQVTNIQNPALQCAAMIVESWNLKILAVGGASTKTALAGLITDAGYNGGGELVTLMTGHWVGVTLFIVACVVWGIVIAHAATRGALERGANEHRTRAFALRSAASQVFMAVVLAGPAAIVILAIGFAAYTLYKRTGLLKALPSVYSLTYLAPVIMG